MNNCLACIVCIVILRVAICQSSHTNRIPSAKLHIDKRSDWNSYILFKPFNGRVSRYECHRTFKIAALSWNCHALVPLSTSLYFHKILSAHGQSVFNPKWKKSYNTLTIAHEMDGMCISFKFQLCCGFYCVFQPLFECKTFILLW